MVLYFSGTGNSKFVAKKAADGIGDTLFSINDGIKNDKFPVVNDDVVIFASPIYAWRLPRIVNKWIKDSNAFSGKKAYFLMTCGGEIGDAEKYIKMLCKECGMAFMGCAEIVMPENYIAMFDCPSENESLDIVSRAEEALNDIIATIKAGKMIASKKVTLVDKLKSGIVNDFYYPFCVSSKKFYTTKDCIGCGKCEALCPTNNISIKNGKPIWHNSCTHCMACICDCPTKAIEYGKISQGKRRYHCPE